MYKLIGSKFIVGGQVAEALARFRSLDSETIGELASDSIGCIY